MVEDNFSALSLSESEALSATYNNNNHDVRGIIPSARDKGSKSKNTHERRLHQNAR